MSVAMKVGVLGSGTLGAAMAGMFARHGHAVRMGSRDPEAAQRSAQGRYRTGSHREAAAESDILFLCVLGEHAAATLRACGPLAGRIVVDCSNPETADGRHLRVGFDTSGAEELLPHAGGAALLKAFNHVYAEFLQDDALLRRQSPTILYCGDDPAAKRTLARLLGSCGLDPLDCGPLRNARYLEPVAMLMVHLVREQGFGPTGISLRMQRSHPHSPG